MIQETYLGSIKQVEIFLTSFEAETPNCVFIAEKEYLNATFWGIFLYNVIGSITREEVAALRGKKPEEI